MSDLDQIRAEHYRLFELVSRQFDEGPVRSVNMGIHTVPMRDDVDMVDVSTFAARCPVGISWRDPQDCMAQGHPAPHYLPVIPEIRMFHPQYFETNECLKHALLHETAHHMHFLDFGYIARNPARLMLKMQFTQILNVAEMVAETSAAIAARILGFADDEQTLAFARYVAMYSVGGGVPTRIPDNEMECIPLIARKLINTYGETN